MLNIIKAELYRIFRGKAIYITFAILISLIVLQVAVENVGRVGISTGTSIDGEIETGTLNGMNAANVMIMTMDNIVYFLLPLFITVASAMFSHGTIKNVLSTGMPRVKLYFTYLLLTSFICVFTMLFYLFGAVALSTILRGFGGSLTKEYLFDILKPFGSQMFIILAFNCIGIFLVFTTKRTAAVSGIYVAFTIVPVIIISMLSVMSEEFLKLYNYDLIGCIRLFSNMNGMSGGDIAKSFLIGAFYILASTIGGVAIFKRSEVK